MPIRAVGVLSAVVLAGCMNHSLPADAHVEAVFPATAKTPELPHQLRVVTFNVHMERGDKIADALAHDPALKDADVIVMEEIHRSNLGCSAACIVGKAFGYYELYAPGHAAGDGDDGVAILSRAPITSSQVIELPHYDVHLNGGRRIALVATIEQASRPITVYAVHLENRLSVRDRRAQMLPVLQHAERQATPVIIAGDFNTSPFTWIAHLVPILTTTQDNRLEELVRAHGFATPVTESGPTSRFRTTDFATARASDVSDHLALWAIIE
ncbi:MAG: endonuclease/exonuclease/phosphatase family protein [Kofleriaceae bacterium]